MPFTDVGATRVRWTRTGSGVLALENGIPGARLHVVPDEGHLVNVEAPMEFRNVVRNFLEPEAPRGPSGRVY